MDGFKRLPHLDACLRMIDGAAKVLQEGIPVHAAMEKRIDDLLKESNSAYVFITERLEFGKRVISVKN